LGLALRFFGSEHIMFGTDFPFGPEDGSWAVEELRAVREIDISDEDRERILHGNLEHLLGL
jgi:aminocarboxymuconate-semialdehyde decarboxylase